ncbi:MAG: 1-hydroxy-2-methyl-2-(E)-butenyl 4-diphosphate synthase, partial [Acinetobacter sp.]
VGIGTLLADGLGDTIRVSLTEDPEFEAPVARALADRFERKAESGKQKSESTSSILHLPSSTYSPYQYSRRVTTPVQQIGGHFHPVVMIDVTKQNLKDPYFLSPLGYNYSAGLDKYNLSDQACDLVYLGDELETSQNLGMQKQREFFVALQQQNIEVPVIIKRTYDNLDADQLMLYSASDLGALLTDGFGDGVWIDAPETIGLSLVNSTSFGILQATRTRISKTEYISCPSCGRTLFDLQETTQYIRSKTDHLKGIKIAIMGCIVNGPGEMADADYGYVGTGPGKITLYRGKEVVKKNVNTPSALDELIEIIREDGNWVETVAS